MIPVESNIPLPPKRPSTGRPEGQLGYPWRAMGVGDSFFVRGRTGGQMAKQVYMRGRADQRRYVVRTVDGGVRVWRVA